MPKAFDVARARAGLETLLYTAVQTDRALFGEPRSGRHAMGCVDPNSLCEGGFEVQFELPGNMRPLSNHQRIVHDPVIARAKEILLELFYEIRAAAPCFDNFGGCLTLQVHNEGDGDFRLDMTLARFNLTRDTASPEEMALRMHKITSQLADYPPWNGEATWRIGNVDLYANTARDAANIHDAMALFAKRPTALLDVRREPMALPA